MMYPRCYNPKDYTDYPNGARVYRSYGPFSTSVKVTDCPCEDGVARTVRFTAYPDTYFSQPGYVRVKGVTITGFVSANHDGPHFIANAYGKNGHLLKKVDRASA